MPIHAVQNAMNLLQARGDLRIGVREVDYRSAFISAVLSTLPKVEVDRDANLVRTRSREATGRRRR